MKVLLRALPIGMFVLSLVEASLSIMLLSYTGKIVFAVTAGLCGALAFVCYSIAVGKD